MPELPEVETTRRGIRRQIRNQSIKKVIIRQPRLRWPVPSGIKTKLAAQTITDVQRRGKYLLITTAVGTLIIHLGMSGSLRVVDSQSKPEKHDHFELEFTNGKSLRLRDPRRFGAVLFTKDDPLKHKLLKDLGPEPFSREFNTEYLFSRSRKRNINIKAFIMDSKIVVGVGNIYASESLFKAGIHPKRAAGKVSKEKYAALVKSIKAVLNKAIKAGGTTLRDFTRSDGKPGYFKQELAVYGRKGEPCIRCSKSITHCVIAQRATYYCTHCQT